MRLRTRTTGPRVPKLLAAALDGHWSFAAAIAAGSVVLGEVVLPLTLGRLPSLHGPVAALEPVAWVVAIVFGAIALWRVGDARLSGGDEWAALLRQAGAAAAPPPGAAPAPDPPSAWTPEVLRRIEWKRLESLCCALHRERGIEVRTVPGGAHGSQDIRLYEDPAQPDRCTTVVHCKTRSKPVAVGPIRALQAAVARAQADGGVLMAPGGFSEEARAYAAARRLVLVDGPAMVDRLRQLPDAAAQRLLALATTGDWTTPSCPECGTRMVERSGTEGAFWGCPTSPDCLGTLPIDPETVAPGLSG